METSLIRAGAYAISWDLGMQLRYGQVTTAPPRNQRPVATSGFFRTADDRWVCVLPRTIDDFTKMMIALDRPELLAEPRYEPPVTEPQAVAELRDICDEAFLQFDLAEICARLKEQDLAHAPLGTLAELAASDYAKEAGCFQPVGDGWGGSFLTTAAPVRFPEGAPPTGRAAPKLGQHTREVLEAAGLKPDEIDGLFATGAAQGPA